MTALLLACALLSNPAPSPAAATAAGADKPLVLSTLPFDAKNDQVAIFAALRDALARRVGQPVQFKPSNSYQDVIAGLRDGSIDVAFVGALGYAKAREGAHAHAILRSVRKGTGSYHGVFIVPSASAVKSVKDLKGKRVVFVDKDSTSGYLYPRMLLKDEGLDPDKDVTALFAGSHHAVVDWVVNGKADAGACFDDAPDQASAAAKLRVVGKTKDVPGDPVVVRGDMPADQIKRVRAALIEATQANDARPFFSAANIDTLVPASDHDYDALVNLAAGSH